MNPNDVIFIVMAIGGVAMVAAIAMAIISNAKKAKDMPERDAPDAISTSLAWDAWLPEYNCHITQQANIFSIYELKAIGSAYMTEDDKDKVVNTINRMMLRFIPGASVSLTAKVDSTIEHILRAYESYGGRDQESDNPGRQLCRDIVKKTADYYRTAAREGFHLRPMNTLRSTRLFLTVLIPNPKRNRRMPQQMRRFMHAVVPEPAAGFFSPAEAWKDLVKAEMERMHFQLKQMDGIVQAGFSEAGVRPTRLGREDAENILYQMRNPYRSSRPGLETIATGDNEFLRNQLSFDDVDDQGNGLLFAGKKFGIVTTMKTIPKTTMSGHFSKLLERIEEGHITINFSVQTASSVSRGMNNKAYLASHSGLVSDVAPYVVEGIKEFKRNMSTGSVVPISFQIVDVRWFDRETTDIDSAKESILTQWDSLGGNGFAETTYAKGMWMRSLPGCYNALDSWWDRRDQLVQSIDLSNMLPVIWSWAGTWRKNKAEARGLFVSRRNELVPVDKRANEAPHGYIVGTTRTGKSVLINQNIANDLACDNTNVYVIDVGDSFGALCSACGPEFAQQLFFDMAKPVCFNPFYLPDHVDMSTIKAKVMDAVAIVASMMIENPEVDRPTAAQQSLIMKAALQTMTDAYEGKYEAELGKHFIPNLRKLNEAGVKGNVIADIIAPFYGPMFGGFFDGPMQFHADRNFVIFELQKVKDNARLMSPLFLVILSFLRSRFYDLPLSVEKNIYIDESHNLMNNDLSAKMVNSFYAEGAKFNFAITMATQNLFKFLDFPGGGNILGQANHGVILSQDMEMTMAKADDLGLSPLKLESIAAVTKQDDRAFSEFLYANAVGTAEEKGDYLRFYAEPSLLHLYATNPLEREARTKLARQYPDLPMMKIAELMAERANQ